MKVNVNVRGTNYEVEIEDITTTPVIARVDGERFEVWPVIDDPELGINDQKEDPHKQPAATLPTKSTSKTHLSQSASTVIKAPIPGVILSIDVSEGDTINVGEELLVLEAMKMKNFISAENPGKIKKILVSIGDNVSHNQPLIELEQTESKP